MSEHDPRPISERQEIELMAACSNLTAEELIYRCAHGIRASFSIDAVLYQLALLNQQTEQALRLPGSEAQQALPALANKTRILGQILLDLRPVIDLSDPNVKAGFEALTQLQAALRS
jgi:hypothetical protein